MRHLLLLSLFALSYAADLEQITTTDGRRFIGYYDGEAQTMTIEGPPKAVVRIPREQVVERSAYIRPEEKDPVKRDAAALVKMEAERIAAIGEAARLFKYAESHSGQEAAAARIQAADRLSLADELSKRMAPIQERAAAAKAAAPKPVAVVVSDQDAPDQLLPATPSSATAKRLEEAFQMEDKACMAKFAAIRAYLADADLSPVKIPKVGPDPRRSDLHARDEAMNENGRRSALASILKAAESADTLSAKDAWCKRALQTAGADLPQSSAARQAEAKAREDAASERDRSVIIRNQPKQRR